MIDNDKRIHDLSVAFAVIKGTSMAQNSFAREVHKEQDSLDSFIIDVMQDAYMESLRHYTEDVENFDLGEYFGEDD